jgi:two-component system, chemotaxis family, sensor kinase CheA
MNTVGGIQVYALLKNFGKILKTIPEFELLYEDNFFPVVDYFITSEIDTKKIEKSCYIPDVTLKIEVNEISETSSKKSKTAKKDKAKKETKKQEKKYEEDKTLELTDEDLKKEKEEERKMEPVIPKRKSTGSVLRVDSKRIDDLLNLITETVINKATLNQINTLFSELMLEFQEANNLYKEDIQKYFEKIPVIISEYQEGASEKDIQKNLINELSSLGSKYDKFSTSLKSITSIFKNTSQNFSRISSELQSGVMQIRMVCVSQIFSRFPRLVRDLSKQLNKNVKLHIEGEDTELDKSVIEDLLDPLIHCVRNSLDHGIESAQARKKAGKTPEGNIFLKASNEGNMIIIDIEDDGQGIDVDDIRKKAIERGLIHESKKLSNAEAFSLIFEPGFSTASKVTNVSGRGVGLDVVKKQIQKLNGNVQVWSEKGEGTKLTIKLPLTLAIIQGLLVRVGKEVYALPISSVVESLRIKPEEIQIIDNYEVFNLREDVLSLIRLNRLFKIEADKEQKFNFVVVVGSGEKMVGILVDSLIGEEDVVIKPLKDRFTSTPGIAGATILGDGTVALIIDVNQLLEFGLKIESAKRQSREVFS